MKKRIIALIAAGAMIASMAPAMSVFADESVGEAPDYSKAECWYQIPEITKDVDTFYIYATEYINSSYDEGAPDYAALDNPEMLEKVPGTLPMCLCLTIARLVCGLLKRSGGKPEALMMHFPACPATI